MQWGRLAAWAYVSGVSALQFHSVTTGTVLFWQSLLTVLQMLLLLSAQAFWVNAPTIWDSLFDNCKHTSLLAHFGVLTESQTISYRLSQATHMIILSQSAWDWPASCDLCRCVNLFWSIDWLVLWAI